MYLADNIFKCCDCWIKYHSFGIRCRVRIRRALVGMAKDQSSFSTKLLIDVVVGHVKLFAYIDRHTLYFIVNYTMGHVIRKYFV